MSSGFIEIISSVTKTIFNKDSLLHFAGNYQQGKQDV